MARQEITVVFRCNPALHQFIMDMARRTGYDKSEVIRLAIAYFRTQVDSGKFVNHNRDQFFDMIKDMDVIPNEPRGPKKQVGKGIRKDDTEEYDDST